MNNSKCPFCGSDPEASVNAFYIKCSNKDCCMHDGFVHANKWEHRQIKFFIFGVDKTPKWFTDLNVNIYDDDYDALHYAILFNSSRLYSMRIDVGDLVFNDNGNIKIYRQKGNPDGRI